MGIGTWTRIWSTLFIGMLLGRWADLRTTTLDYDVYQGQGYDVDFDMAQNMDQDVISHMDQDMYQDMYQDMHQDVDWDMVKISHW